jgi:Tol biopolymer transport system component
MGKAWLSLGVVLALLLASPSTYAASSSAPSVVRQDDLDEGMIAFASTRDGDAEIFVMNPDGSDVRQITHNAYDDHSPDWAPDGRRIVFVREVGGENSDLYIVDTATGKEQAFTTARPWYESDPAWSPNGKWIAFASESPLQDGGDVIALRVDGKRGRAISLQDENSTNVDPTWSPDGKRVAFIEYYDSYDLFVTRFCCSGGYRKRALTTDSMVEFHPEWSPDGSKILYGRTVSRSVFKHGLYTVTPDGAQSVVFEGPLDARPGSWSPSGDEIVFYAQGGTGYDIYRISADGTGLTQLTNDGASDQHPDWSR